MNMKNNEQLNLEFSKELISCLSYNKLKFEVGNGVPTSIGHGPFCKLTNNSVCYDLRYQDKSIYGHTHPLEIKAKISSNMLSEQIDFLKSKEKIAKIIHTHNPKLKGFRLKLSNDISSIKKNFLILSSKKNLPLERDVNILVHLCHESCFNREEELSDLFNYLDSKNINYGVLEENTIGLSHSDFLFKKFTDHLPKFIVSNFNMPLFTILSKSDYDIVENALSYEIELTSAFVRFFYDAKIFGKGGRIDQISKKISLELKKYNFSCFSQQGLSIISSKCDYNLENLISHGIIGSQLNDNIVFTFPTSIKEEHIIEIFNILKKNKK